MKKTIRNEKDLVVWFKKNYKKIGYDSIYKENKNSFPDFVMIKGNRKVNVEIEIKTSHFILHKHSLDKVDEIVCIEKDVKLNAKIIVLKNFAYKPPKAKRVSVTLDDEQLKVLKSLKGLGTKEAEKVKNILLAYLSEKGYFTKK